MDRRVRTVDGRAELERLLAAIVRRLRLRGATAALALGTCWLFGALVVYQLALAVTAPVFLLESLRWMLVVAVVLALAVIARRALRRVTGDEAARLADREADLSDELKSAYYFCRNGVGSRGVEGRKVAPPGDEGRGDEGRGGEGLGGEDLHGRLVGLLMERAGSDAARVDPRRLVPWIVPRSATPAVALAVAAVGLAWWSPRWNVALPGALHPMESRASARPVDQGGLPDRPDGVDRRDATTGANPSASIEQAAAATAAKAGGRAAAEDAGDQGVATPSRQSERARGLAGAAPTRDPRRLAEPNLGPDREPAVKSGEDRSFAQVARPTRHRSGKADDPAGDATSSPDDPFRAQIDRQGLDADKSAENDLQRAMKAAEQRAAEQGNQPPPQTRAGNPDNANSNGPRPEGSEDGETQIGGQMEGNNPGGNSQVAEGSGNNVSLAAGADSRSPGAAEHSKSPSDLAAAPVEGPKTMRLQAQLQRVRVDGQPSDDNANDGAEERLYAATRAQRSRLDYQAAASQPRQTREATTTGERVPLAHRAVVKDYFLNLRKAGHNDD